MRLARWLRQPQTNKKTQSVLGQLPTANQAPSEPAQRCGPAGPPRPPERVRKYWLAGKPEALVISPHPRARMRARPGSHFLHPVIQWGRGAAHPTQPGPRRPGASPRRACVLGWPGRFEAGRRNKVFGFFFPLLPPLLFPPATYGSAALARLVGCVRLARPAQLSAQRGLAEGGLASGVRSLPVTVRSPRRPRSGRVGGDSGLGKRVRPLPEEAGGPGTAGGLLEPPSARRVGPGTVGRGWEWGRGEAGERPCAGEGRLGGGGEGPWPGPAWRAFGPLDNPFLVSRGRRGSNYPIRGKGVEEAWGVWSLHLQSCGELSESFKAEKKGFEEARVIWYLTPRVVWRGSRGNA